MRLLVVDDHPLVRKGIISTLSLEQGIEDIQEASGVDEAVTAISKGKPDITIVDLNLGNEDGLDVISKAKQKKLNSKFVVLTSSSKREDFERAQRMNVDGYILKEAFTEDIIYAFKVIARGKSFYDATIVKLKLNQERNPILEELTQRELEVFKELGKGYSNKQIAKCLFIAENTVKKHVSTILDKLGFEHRTEAAIEASKAFSSDIN